MLETRSATLNAANVDAFRAGMRELGYTQGQNLEIVYWSADGRDEQFPRLASELVRLKVDLILTRGTPATLAAKSATRTIPVVMTAVGDPVVTGLVASLGHPGGNVTGLSLVNVEIFAKRVQLLRELLPRLARIAGLFNMGNETGGGGGAIFQPHTATSRRATRRGFAGGLRGGGDAACRRAHRGPRRSYAGESTTDCRACCQAATAVDLCDERVCGLGRLDGLRTERTLPVPASGHLR